MMTITEKIRLSVRDEEDLTVMSSLLQDSLIALAEVKYLPDEKRFVFVANRFLWERENQEALDLCEGENFSRVLCGVCFENVTGVRQKGLQRDRKGQIVSLLSVSKLQNNRIQLNFSANILIRLDVSDLFCHFQDIDSPWPTDVKPQHEKTYC